MLPEDRKDYGSNGEYYPLELMIVVMFLFQVLRVGSLVHCQCTSDVFLMDWEKVRTMRRVLGATQTCKRKKYGRDSAHVRCT